MSWKSSGRKVGISKRDEYERELIEIIGSRSDFFGQRGTHSKGIDVLFLKTTGMKYESKCIRGEVKTSAAPKIYLTVTKRSLAQYNNYLDIWNTHRVMTFYFFRLITSKRRLERKTRTGEYDLIMFREGHKEDKWRVFTLDKLPMSRNDRPYLDLFDENAMTIKEFLELF